MRILFAEDEPVLAGQIKKELLGQGWYVDHVSDGIRAQQQLKSRNHDLLILDLGLPGRDGMSVLRALRAEGIDVPVIVVSARRNWTDRVAGLDAGADDYLAKPFQMEELIARVRALLRRSEADKSAVFKRGDLVFDSRTNKLTRNAVAINLTSHELSILTFLFRNMDRLVPGPELAAYLYPDDYNLRSNTIAVFVNRLRKKLGSDVINTVRGRGYIIKSNG